MPKSKLINLQNNFFKVPAVLGLRYLQSFAAMKVTLSYLTQKEQLSTQQICIWFYNVGTGRVQTRVSFHLSTCLFTYFWN